MTATLRTDGIRAEPHPGDGEPARTVVALTRAEVPVQATAGLHHAIRNTDPGTCSIPEPWAERTALGLLGRPDHRGGDH